MDRDRELCTKASLLRSLHRALMSTVLSLPSLDSTNGKLPWVVDMANHASAHKNTDSFGSAPSKPQATRPYTSAIVRKKNRRGSKKILEMPVNRRIRKVAKDKRYTTRRTFRVSKSRQQKVRNRKRRIERRLRARNWSKQDEPMFKASNIHYELSERTRGVGVGGIGAIHKLALESGLVEAIDESVDVLKVHLPYHESDHVLNIAYNIMSGGTCLEERV